MKAAAAVSHRVQIENVLCATDFSHAAAAALPFAAQIAKSFGAKLFVIHAKTPENYAVPVPENWAAANAQLEEFVVETRRNLFNQFPSVESDVLVADGGVSAVVEKLAQEKKADLIVVGTSGRGGLGKFILGSTAEDVLRRADCPVLTVGPHSQSQPPQGARFAKIVYATNFSDTSATAAAYAVTLAQEFQAQLTLLHVIEHPKAGDAVHPHELEEAALVRLRGLVAKDAELWCEPKAVVLQGLPAQGILEAAQKEGADLIVLGLRHPKGLVRATHLPTVAHHVIAGATCPVLTIRA
jgi:nucleotide-binding universal stress UspA family protein